LAQTFCCFLVDEREPTQVTENGKFFFWLAGSLCYFFLVKNTEKKLPKKGNAPGRSERKMVQKTSGWQR